MFALRLAAILAMTIVSVRAADFSAAAADCTSHPCFVRPDIAELLPQQRLLRRVAIFSDDPDTVHDPRHPQSQTGVDKMFAPIGLISTNNPVPHQSGPTTTLNRDMATAFLVSPCYILTNYHVVFGNVQSKPAADRDFSATFRVGGKKARAVPEKYGEFYRFEGRDWALLLLDADAEHPCLGEDPDIGWVQLAPLKSDDAMKKTLSSAGYPSDKSGSTLWRQDTCHLYQKHLDIEHDGVWTTDCATQPRASGSPIFFVQDGVLHVVALMEGHLGDIGNEILPRWDPDRANIAVDIGKIISSDPDFLKLIARDIDRFPQPSPATRAIRPENPAQSSSEPLGANQ